MENKEQPAINSDLTSELTVKKEMVIQPTVASVEAIQAAQAEANQTVPSQNIPAQPPATPLPANQPPQSVPPPSSIYPEATKGVGMPPPAVSPTPVAPSTEPSLIDAQITAKILLVRLVAGSILLINAVNAYNWFLERKGGYTSWPNIIEILIMLGLTASIFKLSEAARAAYVLISEILIILTCASLALFYVRNHNNPIFTQGISSLTKSELQQGITRDEHDPHLTAKQKQQLVSILQTQLNKDTESTIDVRAKEYLSEALLITTTVGPIIFFTRPSIRSVFN